MDSAASAPTHPQNAFLPYLTTEQRDRLKDSIEAEGIHTPIVQDQNGQVIDGVERLAIAEELGLHSYPVRTVHCPDERTRRHLRLQLNCNRRQLSGKQKRTLIADELRRSPELSDRYIASLIGASHRTVAAVRAALERTGQIDQLRVKLGRDGKRRRLPVIATETKKRADRAAKLLKAIHDPPGRSLKMTDAKRLVRNTRLRLATDSKDSAGGG